MKKLLLPLIACGSLLTATTHLVADSKEAGIQTAAYVKTAIDLVSYPLIPLIVGGAAVSSKLATQFSNDIITADLSKMIIFGTGLGLGCLAGMMLRALYVKTHKLYGFSDKEIDEICTQSYAQQGWVFAQAGTIAWFIFEYYRIQREREQKRQSSRPVTVTIIRY